MDRTRGIWDLKGDNSLHGEGNGNQLQYSLPGESYGQRSLTGYSPWDHKYLDTESLLSCDVATEHIHIHVRYTVT